MYYGGKKYQRVTHKLLFRRGHRRYFIYFSDVTLCVRVCVDKPSSVVVVYRVVRGTGTRNRIRTRAFECALFCYSRRVWTTRPESITADERLRTPSLTNVFGTYAGFRFFGKQTIVSRVTPSD